jgi:hypothetical protein
LLVIVISFQFILITFLICRSPFKNAFKPKAKTSDQDMFELVTAWGRILATQHTRADNKYFNGKYVKTSFANGVSDAISTNQPIFVDLVTQVALTYAQQVNLDFKLFVVDVHK